MFGGVFQNRSVWLSGVTGFKGAWLATWLVRMGARVRGFSLAPPTDPSLFDRLELSREIEFEFGDIRDAGLVRKSIESQQPDFVFHLAAQSLVRLSYETALETYATNVMGTAHVLDALRGLKKPCAAVMVTTDKCYENREWHYGYREEDALGGADPYSSSKAAAEIAIASWRRSFFRDHPVRIASARAGNVIGGGDWGRDRIVPDCMRALAAGETIGVRRPDSVRPWQHVLEPLGGYLWLASRLYRSGADTAGDSGFGSLAGAFNFGPAGESQRTVRTLVEELLRHWPGSWEDRSDPRAVHESRLLHLSVDKARALLGWAPVWDFSETVERTVAWYRAYASGLDARALAGLTRSQVESYEAAALSARAPWAVADA